MTSTLSPPPPASPARSGSNAKDAGGGGDGDSVCRFSAAADDKCRLGLWRLGPPQLAEITRGGWGLVTVEDYLAIRPDAELEMDWLGGL